MIRKFFGSSNQPWAKLKVSLLPGKYSFFAHQIHSNNVKVIEEADLVAKKVVVPKVDALVTKLKDINLIIKTADCVPILFADSTEGVIAAVHAGRKGVRTNICAEVIAKMLALGSKVENIIAEMGPAICGLHYQVSKQMQEEFQAATGVQQQPEYIDLKKTLRAQLLAAGLLENHIYNNNICTFESDYHFSYRFNQTKQRQYSYIIRQNII
jgi:hypothetical protein